MKKAILFALITGFLSTSSFAEKTIITSKTQLKDWIRPWVLKREVLDSYGVYNLSGVPIQVGYFVNSDLDDGRKNSDIVTFTCDNNVSYLMPGQWGMCTLEDRADSEVHIDDKNYMNGAEGFTQFYD